MQLCVNLPIANSSVAIAVLLLILSLEAGRGGALCALRLQRDVFIKAYKVPLLRLTLRCDNLICRGQKKGYTQRAAFFSKVNILIVLPPRDRMA